MIADYGIDPETDRHRSNPESHWRLYDSPGNAASEAGPCVIQVQDFDYRDYDARRFMTAQAYATEEDANLALGTFLFRDRLLHENSPYEKLARAVDEINNIATELSDALDVDSPVTAAEAALRSLRQLQRDLIR
jgi:hypothetical protein